MQRRSPACTSRGPGRSRPRRPVCTASGSTVRAISRCSSTAAKCSTAGGRTGTPGTTISTCSLPPGSRTRCASSGSRNAGYIALLHSDPLPEADRHSLTLSSESRRAIDYYFVAGRNMDEVIAGYRGLTGKAPIMPKWAYGFWQSRQRYETQDQLLGVLAEYRKRGLPLDNIVQDWFYWPEDQWGCQCFDTARFPDPRRWSTQVHANNAHVMISVWAKYYKGIRQLQGAGRDRRHLPPHGHPRPDEPKDPNYIKAMYLDWVGPGYLNAFYDPYNPKRARHLLAPGHGGIEKQGLRRLVARFRRARLPFEPLQAEEPRPHGPDRAGPGAALLQLLSAGPRRRRLRPPGRRTSPTSARSSSRARPSAASSATRRGLVGRRRLALGQSARADFGRASISRMSGVPNWSHDIGGFTMEDRYFRSRRRPDLDEWRELNTRWFQFGAFSPIFRSHGENIQARDLRDVAGRARRPTGRWSGTTGCATG